MQKSRFLFPAALIAIGAALRFFELGQESFWTDEIVTLSRSTLPFNRLGRHLLLTNHPPFYFMAMNLWSHVLGANEFLLRFPSSVFGTLCVPAALWAGRSVIGREGALLSAGFLTLLPFHIYYSQEARAYSLIFLCAIIFMGALFRLLFYEEAPRLSAITIVISGAIGLYSHFVFVLFLAAGVILGGASFTLPLWKRAVQPRLKLFVLSVSSILVLFAPWFILSPRQINKLPSYHDSSEPVGLFHFFVRMESIWGTVFSPYPATRIWYFLWSAGLLAVVVLGIIQLFRIHLAEKHSGTPTSGLSKTAVFAWLFIWVFLPFIMIGTAFLAVGLPAAERYFMPMLPGFVFIFGFLACQIPRFTRLSLTLLIAGAYLGFLFHIYYPQPMKTPWREICQQAASLAKPGDALLILADHSRQPVQYYYRGQVRARPCDAAFDQPVDRVWIVEVSEPQPPVSNPKTIPVILGKEYYLRDSFLLAPYSTMSRYERLVPEPSP